MSVTFPFYKQSGPKDCGPTCIKSISKFYGKDVDIQQLRNYCETTKAGTSLLGLQEGAEKIGFKTVAITTNFKTLSEEPILPCIVHWRKNHYVVVYEIKDSKVFVSDPARGLITYDKNAFLRNWIDKEASEDTPSGIVLVLDTTPSFI